MSTDTELREHRTSATAHAPEGVKLHMFECGTPTPRSLPRAASTSTRSRPIGLRFAAGGYIQADYRKPGVPWALLEDTEDGYDVFGDGTIRCWRTPGHAPGLQVGLGRAAWRSVGAGTCASEGESEPPLGG
jgi:hypothetical protein